MYASGELQKLLGVDEAKTEAPAPKVTITTPAREGLQGRREADAGDDVLRLEITHSSSTTSSSAPKKPGDLDVESAGVTVHFDAECAARADGVTIDFVDEPAEAALQASTTRTSRRA